MELRPALMPPVLDKEKVARLARFAAQLDGSASSQCDYELAEFNREAGTHFVHLDFQGISGGMDHDEWVQSVLVESGVKPIPDITRAELLELIRRVCAGEGEEHETWFWMRLLEANVPDPMISDLIYWPGEYFGDGDNSRKLSPKQILDIALTAGKKQDA